MNDIPAPYSLLPTFYKLLIVKMFKPHTLPQVMK